MPYNPGGQTGPPGPPGPTAVIQDEGVPLAGAPHTTLNFAGAGVLASNAGLGVALITIPGGGAPIEPANQIVFGTGAGIDSDADFTFDPATGQFRVNTTDGTTHTTVAIPGNISILGAHASGVDTNGGNIQIQAGENTGTGTPGFVALTAAAADAGSVQNGGVATIESGAGDDTANGGTLNVLSGQSGANAGNGGTVNIQAGSGITSGGIAQVLAGNSDGVGGDARLMGGSSTVSGNGGGATVQGGDASGIGNGGVLDLVAGNGGTTSGAGAALNIQAGSAIASGDGGSINLNAGSAAGINEDGGDIILTAGLAVGTGIDGSIQLNFPATGELEIDGDPGAAGEVLTSQGPALPPVWSPASGPTVFTSANQTITSAGTLTLAHGLSGAPEIVGTYLVNITAEHGYAVGDVVAVGEYIGSSERGTSLVIDATNLVIRYSSSAAVFNVLNKTTGTSAAITPANWRTRFVAVKF